MTRQPMTPAEIDEARPTLAPCCIPFVDTIDALRELLRGELAMAARAAESHKKRQAESDALLLAMVRDCVPDGAITTADDAAWTAARKHLIDHDLLTEGE